MKTESRPLRFFPHSAGLGGLPLALLGLGLIVAAVSAQPAGRTRLHGHVPAAVAKLGPSGRLAASTNLYLALGLPLRDEAGLSQFLRDLYDPGSPRFHHYLTPAEFTERFGPTEQQYQQVIAFARSSGFHVTHTHPNRLILDVTATAADIERAFQITLRIYQHPTELRTFFAPDSEPSIPTGLPLLSISGLENFMPPRPRDLKVKPKAKNPRLAPGASSSVLVGLSDFELRASDFPAPDPFEVISNATGSGPGGDFLGYDFRAAYAPGVPLTGVGQVVGLFQFGPYYTNDIYLYQQRAGLPTNIVITNILLNGVTGIPVGDNFDDGEEALDIDMAMSMAPGAVIMVYEGNNADDILNRMATDNLAKQIGCSWGWSPPSGAMNNILLQLTAQGQSFFVASGDGGAYSTNLIFAPEDNPNVTSVGGTSLTTSGAGGPWQSETTWSGSGGGISIRYPIPAYQQGINMAPIHGSTTMRNFPDVAMLAEPTIFWYLKNGQSGTVGGTSAAAPLWAGFMALVNQQATANGKPPLGFLNQTIYSLGQSASYSSCLHDVTTGNNFNTASPTNFAAALGYDLCTGWGSPNGTNFINALAGPNDPLQISPGTGFTDVVPFGTPFGPTNIVFTLTNLGASDLNWTLVNTSIWLTASSGTGTLPAGGAATPLTISLNTATAGSLGFGYYYANVWFTNLSTHVAQSRLFTLVVSGANWPLAVAGFNAGVIVPNNATTANQQAIGFDTANNCFYQAGLNNNPQVSGSGGVQGLPLNASFSSQFDGTTVFQLGPYGGNNVLFLGRLFAASGMLTLSNPRSLNSLVVLSCSANGGGLGTLIINFTNGSSSQPFTFNSQDWFNTTANVALSGFGRLELNNGLFTEDNGSSNPNFYQTTINLASLGSNQPVGSITFTKPAASGNSGVFAVSGAVMPPQVTITQQPRSATNSTTSQGVIFAVAAMGVPPLAYQWYYSTNGNAGTYGPLPNQTNAALALNPVLQPTNAGSFFVVVTNTYNAVTSAVATLTVYRAPAITLQPSPTNLMLFVGRSATLSVAAIGGLPLSYYWNFNGVPLAGATGTSYALSNLQLTNSGAYSVLVSNTFGSTTSSIVTLTVLPLPTYPYGQVVLADHPVGYWRLDETNAFVATGIPAHDYIAGHNGTYSKVLLNQTGNNLIDTHKAAKFGFVAGNNNCVSNIPVDFAGSANSAFSVEAWVNGAAQSSDSGLVSRGTGAGGEQFSLDCGSGTGHAFRFLVRDAGGGVHLANGSVAPNNRWHHLVGVCDEANGQVYLYIDGVANATGAITPGSGIQSGPNPVVIGSRPSSASSAYDLQFSGLMEEVALYNYALTAAQVQTHYQVVTNRPPVFLANPFFAPAANAGQAYSATIATNAVDPNGDSVTFAKLNGPVWLTVSGAGALSGTPLSADVGTNTFALSAADPAGLSNSATLYITVAPALPINASVAFMGTNLFLSWGGGAGPYQVQMATNLSNPIWQDLGLLINTNSVTIVPSNDAAFYRVIGE